MSTVYNKDYYDQYDVGEETVQYENSSYTKDFLHTVAERIVSDFHPNTVLDVGCAMGYLVEALRDRGVQAYGIDVSDYAVSRVRGDIKPYCKVCSAADGLPDGFPDQFDLIVSIEVFEHLYEEEAVKAIRMICDHTEQVIFSSTPDDTRDTTHINVQQAEYWVNKFAACGFYHAVDYQPSYVTPWALAFYQTDNLPRMAENYERHLRISAQTAAETQAQCSGLAEQLERAAQEAEELSARCGQLEKQADAFQKANGLSEIRLNKVNQSYQQLHAQYTELLEKHSALEQNYQVISRSTFWKLSKPFRVLFDLIKRAFKKSRVLGLFYKGLASLKNDGVRATVSRVKHRRRNINDYKQYMKEHALSEAEKEEQRNTKFSKKVTFSIIVPLYNTPEQYLREMIQSVLDQTYGDWELCMADGSDSEHPGVESVCAEYTARDSRIHYKKLDKNYGISGNTNECMKMATGNYISLFDHDDILHPAALFETMKVIEEQGADFIYTDEMVFEGTLENVTLIHFKPDFSIDTLRGHNYICHFSSFSAELQSEVGLFSEEHNGSQDYDLVLRLSEKAKHIVHIPQVLYFWRSHPASVASDVSVKPYCMTSAKKALADHLKRVGLEGEVVDSSVLSTYKINYKIQGNPKVSILIPNKDYITDLDKCIQSIFEKSTYPNFEIIVIENNSDEVATFNYYDSIQAIHENVKVVQWKGPFNYSAINNFGYQYATGEYILLLNNDMEVITPNWLEEMVMYIQREDVGAVGAKLYYPDNTIQHAGIIVGIGSTAGHAHKHFDRTSGGYIHRLTIAQDMSCVTGACLMTKRSVWEELSGLDEDFVVAFNDVDFCLRIRQAGYLVVFTPYAELYHYESKSRGYEDTPEKKKRFDREAARLRSKWKDVFEKGDPYYNPNFTLDREDFTLK